jgi:hypothetical protein
MRGRTTSKRFLGIGVALLLFAALGMHATLFYVRGAVPVSMPPTAVRKRILALTKAEVALLRAWIDQGADWPTRALLISPRIKKPR